MTRISLCLIARDEEALLPACLASVRAAVDEIVLVDTGSSDATRGLARAAGARVYEQPWRGDFAAPRNEAVRRATGDFILQLDADERLAPGAAAVLRAAVRDPCFDLGMLPLHEAVRLDSDLGEVVAGRARRAPPMRLPRLLRNADGLEYRGIIHESVERWFVRRGSRAAYVDADIVHLGSVPELRAARGKRERNLPLLRRRCQDDPNDATGFAYLAAELLEMGDVPGAQAAADAGWAVAGTAPRARSLHRLGVVRATLGLRRGDPASALAAVDAVEARQGPHVDLAYLRGCALYLLALRAVGDERRALAERAAAAYAAAEGLCGAPAAERLTEATAGARLLVYRGDALLVAARPAEASAAFSAALSEEPRSRPARVGLAESALETGDARRALELVEPALGETPDGWTVAAAAALALGAHGDAALLAARARERVARGFEAAHRRARLASMGEPPCVAPARAPAPSGEPANAPPHRVEPVAPRLAVTVLSPPGYPHSAAFREVAETLQHGLAALGCDVVLGTDPGLAGRRHVVLGANLAGPDARLPEGAILYNLEQIEEGSPWLTPALLALYRRHPLWDYSRANADALARLGVPRPRLVPIGYVPQLTRIAPAPEDLDVLFYGSMNGRRASVLEELARRGARVHVVYGLYGAERDALVARSRIVLNVHYYQAKVFEIVRVSYLLANRRAVVSERGCDRAEEAPFEAGVAFAEHARLADRCLELLARPDERARLAEAGFRIMSARRAPDYLRDVVAELAGG